MGTIHMALRRLFAGTYGINDFYLATQEPSCRCAPSNPSPTEAHIFSLVIDVVCRVDVGYDALFI